MFVDIVRRGELRSLDIFIERGEFGSVIGIPVWEG